MSIRVAKLIISSTASFLFVLLPSITCLQVTVTTPYVIFALLFLVLFLMEWFSRSEQPSVGPNA